MRVQSKQFSYVFIIVGIFIVLNTIFSGPQAYGSKWYGVINLILVGIMSIFIGIYLLRKTNILLQLLSYYFLIFGIFEILITILAGSKSYGYKWYVAMIPIIISIISLGLGIYGLKKVKANKLK